MAVFSTDGVLLPQSARPVGTGTRGGGLVVERRRRATRPRARRNRRRQIFGSILDPPRSPFSEEWIRPAI
jgi:hypothetical protein